MTDSPFPSDSPEEQEPNMCEPDAEDAEDPNDTPEDDEYYSDSLETLDHKIRSAGMPKRARQFALEELRYLRDGSQDSHFSATRKRWLGYVVRLPFQKRTAPPTDIAAVAAALDGSHFGMQRIKNIILEQVALQRRLPGKQVAPIICLVGPPGVGKTSVARAIAHALRRRYAQISLAGMSDAACLTGFNNSYGSASPGQIVQALIAAGTCNPMILLDEIDKISAWHLGDPAAALLPVLDPRQNHHYVDHYLGINIPLDLSETLWIATANDANAISGPLRDRMTVIELPGYDELAKIAIAERHLLPRQLAENGLTSAEIEITLAALGVIVAHYSFAEAGVRELERLLGSILRRVVLYKEAGGEAPPGLDAHGVVRVTEAQVAAYLGGPKMQHITLDPTPQVGLANALAQTETGGKVALVEVKRFAGNGHLVMTGSLANDLKESVMVAHTAIRDQAARWNIPEALFERQDLHVHFQEGEIPKMGPSAGLAIAVAIISAYTGRAISPTLAFTGEINLSGRLLPIGGLSHKLMGAYRAGITAVIIPHDQDYSELDSLPLQVCKQVKLYPVGTLAEAVALIPRLGGPAVGAVPVATLVRR